MQKDIIVMEFIVALLRSLQEDGGCECTPPQGEICDCEINGADLTAELCSTLIRLQESNK